VEVSRIFIMDDEKSAVAQVRAFSAGTSKTLEWNEGHVLALRRESPERVRRSTLSGCRRHRDNGISANTKVIIYTIERCATL